MKALVEIITHLSAILFPALSSWESCALHLIRTHRPSAVSFVCKTADQCPQNQLYKVVFHTPLQTIFGLEPHQLPPFQESELVFLPIHEDGLEWKNETIQKYLQGGKNFFKIVIVASMRNNSEDDFQFLSKLFKDMWKSGIVNGAAILKNESTSLIFTYIPFRSNDTCGDTSPVKIGNCVENAETVFDATYKVINLNTCPLTVSIAVDKPWFQKEPFIGRLKPLLEEVSFRMNFTVNTIWPSEGVNGGICGPQERTGTKGDVANGRAHLAVGTFHQIECSTMEYIRIPFINCLSWCVPIITAKDYIYTFLISFFRPEVWLALVVTAVVVVICVRILCSMSKDRLAPNDVVYLVLVVFTPVPLDYRSRPVRIVFGFWLCTCLVIRTAYEGELKSRCAAPLARYVIKDLSGIVDQVQSKKFKNICTTVGNLQVLKTIYDPHVQFLYKRSNICTDGMYANILKAALDKDRAIFTSELRCQVTAAELGTNGSPLVFPQTGGCIRPNQMVVMITLPGSPFRKTLDRIQHLTFDSGLFLKWIGKQSKKTPQNEVLALSLNQLLPAAFVLCLGCFIGFLVLMIEIVRECCRD